MQKESVISYAQAMKRIQSDPLKLAAHLGYKVMYLDSPERFLTSRSATYGNNKLIFINIKYHLKKEKCFVLMN